MLYGTTFLLFSGMFYDVVLVWPPHATLLTVLLAPANSFEEMLYRVVQNVAFVWIKQHATMCNKCCMMFYEMLHSFDRGFSSIMLFCSQVESILLKEPG